MSQRILVIDDDPDIIAMTQSRLRLRGFDVDTAVNGVDGLGLAERQRPDLVITDILMPEMDGFTFYKEFKKDLENAQIPVLILTARGQMEDTFRAMGVDEFITKPFTMDELLIRINSLLARLPMKE